MWNHYDKRVLPSAEETMQAKETIRDLENELEAVVKLLEQTKRRIDELKADLEQRRAWIAPIRRIPFEILSEIFILCSREERLAPTTIASISREWRSTILATPQAWSSIFPQPQPYQTLLPPIYVSLYLERSNPFPLHVSARWPRDVCMCNYEKESKRCDCRNVELIFEQPDRLECLRVSYGRLRESSGTVFPCLTRLTIAEEPIGECGILDMSNLPSLQHLDISAAASLNSLFDFSRVNPPPLQYLSLEMDGDRLWCDLTMLCSYSLKTLVLRCELEESISQQWEIECPQLECLSVRDMTHEAEPLILKINTPNLAYYDFSSEWGILHIEFLAGTKTFTHMRTDRILPLRNYPHLHILQLYNYPELVSAVLDGLDADYTVCPELEMLELRDIDIDGPILHNMVRQRVIDRNTMSGSHIKFISDEEWSIEMPTYYEECGYDMACTGDW